jgi:hypothetical protein
MLDSLSKEIYLGPMLLTAVRRGRFDDVKTLYHEGADINFQDAFSNHDTPLHMALKFGHFEIARYLIQNGANVNAYDALRTTPLHVALKLGRSEIAQYLIEKGADANARDALDTTPLHIAVVGNNIKIVEVLLNGGADLEAHTGTLGETLLHLAARQNFSTIIEFLIDKGANIEARCNFSDETPLHVAACQGHLATVKSLLEKGADLRALTRFSETPLDSVKKIRGYSTYTRQEQQKNQDEVIKYLEDRLEFSESLLFSAILAGATATIATYFCLSPLILLTEAITISLLMGGMIGLLVELYRPIVRGLINIWAGWKLNDALDSQNSAQELENNPYFVQGKKAEDSDRAYLESLTWLSTYLPFRKASRDFYAGMAFQQQFHHTGIDTIEGLRKERATAPQKP